MNVQRKGVDRARLAWITAGIVIVIAILSTLTLSNPNDASRLNVSGSGGGEASQGSGDVGPGSVSDSGATTSIAPGAVNPATRNYDCSKGQNAGVSDTGVSKGEVRLAATVARTGIARDFLADAEWSMEAVRLKVNRAGGICGRVLTVDYRNDEWNPSNGQRIIEGFIGEKKYLGLAVNPSSEGLRGAIDSLVIRNNRFAAVGADGMLIDQYLDPWVWPVATSTASVMHVMARNGYERGARKFGIVWEENYRFGVEGHAAFVAAVKRAGGTISADTAVQGGLTDYSEKVHDFIGKCGGQDKLDQCDFLAMLLEPVTASQWVRNGGLGNGDVRPKVGIGAPQPLFLDSFARDCGKYCANMWVWTSFKPPIPPFDTEPLVATYKSDVAAVRSTADPNNPHVEGAYVGMLLLVDALKKLGPAPNRGDLQHLLDSISLETGLAPTLKFRAGNHFAAVSVQAFEAIVNNNSFTNWRYTNSGFIQDVDAGKDIPT